MEGLSAKLDRLLTRALQPEYAEPCLKVFVSGVCSHTLNATDRMHKCALNIECSGVCHCGDSLDRHSDPFVCGHTPVEMIRQHDGLHRCVCGKEWRECFI